jgi:hypothetical protein
MEGGAGVVRIPSVRLWFEFLILDVLGCCWSFRM